MNIGICSSSAPFTGMVRDLPRRALVKASVCAANCTLSLHQATGERRKSQTTPIVQRSDSPWLRKRMKETGFHLDGFRDYETHRKDRTIGNKFCRLSIKHIMCLEPDYLQHQAASVKVPMLAARRPATFDQSH